METGLRNRVALVAGASQGLGRAAAFALAAEGAHVALCARNSQALEHAGSSIREKYGVQVHTEALDVHDSSRIQRFVKNVGQLFDRIGELIDMQQQVARAIQALGLLGLAGAGHLS